MSIISCSIVVDCTNFRIRHGVSHDSQNIRKRIIRSVREIFQPWSKVYVTVYESLGFIERF